MKGFIHGVIDGRKETAFLIENDRFIQFGTDEEIANQLSAQDETIDLNGSYVMSGLADGRVHLIDIGKSVEQADLRGVDRVEELKKRLQDQKKAENGWVLGRGFEVSLLEDENPRVALDQLYPHDPVAFLDLSGHAMIVNGEAMKAAGIAEGSTVEGGFIDFAKGILKETAVQIMLNAIPQADEKTLERWILKGCTVLNRHGITACVSDDLLSNGNDWKGVLDAFMQLSYQQQLTVRVIETCRFPSPEDFADFLNEGYTTGVGDAFFRIGPLQLTADGDISLHTAALTSSFDKEGDLIYTRDEMKILSDLANEYNMPACIHAEGDKAVKESLKLLDKVILSGNPLHYSLEGVHVITKEDAKRIEKMQLDVYTDGISRNEKSALLPFETMYDRIALSTNAPAGSPDLFALVHHMSQYIDYDKALVMAENTIVMNEFNDETGKLEEGMKADFIVTEKKPSAMEEPKLLMTVSNGETVFEK